MDGAGQLYGVQRSCTISVIVTDSQGLSVDGTFTQLVDPAPHELTFTTPPSGTPNPVTSGGTTSLNVMASDSYDHGLTYAWSASCPGLPGNGVFLPTSTERTPTWTAPVNQTGLVKACTLTVTATDGLGLTASTSYSQEIELAPHSLIVKVPAAGSPNPVESGESVEFTVTFEDSHSHPILHTWQATCPGLASNGTFVPNNTAESPTWVAPANKTGAPQVCTIDVQADRHAGADRHQLVYEGPDRQRAGGRHHDCPGSGGTPNPGPSGGNVALSVSSTDSYAHTLSYAWTASCPTLPGNGELHAERGRSNAHVDGAEQPHGVGAELHDRASPSTIAPAR